MLPHIQVTDVLQGRSGFIFGFKESKTKFVVVLYVK
jgi:hypothetical protein